MKLVTIEVAGKERVGVHLSDRIAEIKEVPSMIELLRRGESGLELARRAASDAAVGCVHSLEDVKIHAPIPRPGKIICLGLNYAQHAREGGSKLPSEPVIFCKAGSSVIAAGENIEIPKVTFKVDYEAELACVIGRKGKNIPAESAMAHVSGYTLINDVSARDYQAEKPAGQWFLGKSFDTFCPMGPWMVTSDEIPDHSSLPVRCVLNGLVVQDSSTKDQIFSIPLIIQYISRVFTLEPGDLIATGTPSGVGAARKPPVWLKPGDIVRVEVDGVGALENPVAAEQ